MGNPLILLEFKTFLWVGVMSQVWVLSLSLIPCSPAEFYLIFHPLWTTEWVPCIWFNVQIAQPSPQVLGLRGIHWTTSPIIPFCWMEDPLNRKRSKLMKYSFVDCLFWSAIQTGLILVNRALPYMFLPSMQKAESPLQLCDLSTLKFAKLSGWVAKARQMSE